ncbi:hypothetical protein KR059_011230, partial [Drosophila kikkawai]
QCDGCVVANDSHSKIDELDSKIKNLECLYQHLNSKFSEAFPTKGDSIEHTNNVTVRPSRRQAANATVAPQSYAAAASSSSFQGQGLRPPNAERDGFVKVPHRKRKNNNNNKKTVVGVASASDSLQVLPIVKYLHAGKFKATTEPEAVLNYVSSKLNVDTKAFSCIKLIKKDVDISTLKFVNFKLGVPDQYYNDVFSNEFWPCSVKVKRFVHRERTNKEDTIIELGGPARTSTPTHSSKNPQ